MTPSWTINGRFLTQPATGVQRFARQIVTAMDSQVTEASKFNLLVPSGAKAIAGLSNIGTNIAAPGRGHLWEQTSLPYQMDGRLLSLCNTGPLAAGQQIVCIHDANVWDFSASYSLLFRTFYKALIPALARRALKVLTVSRASADTLIAHGIVKASKIEIVSNGHEHVFGWDASRSVFSGPDRSPLRPFVFALGSRAPHKNLDLLLKIAPQLDDMGLDLYVSGASLGIFSSETLRDVPKNVKMLGFVSDDDLAALYKQAVCLAFPSFVEGFGIPLVEAMAFGCPIISSDTSCMPEICGEYAQYASPFIPEAWVEGIRAIHTDKDRRHRSATSKLAKYSWAKSASDVIALCRNY